MALKKQNSAPMRAIGWSVALAAGLACAPASAQLITDESLIINPLENPAAAAAQPLMPGAPTPAPAAAPPALPLIESRPALMDAPPPPAPVTQPALAAPAVETPVEQQAAPAPAPAVDDGSLRLPGQPAAAADAPDSNEISVPDDTTGDNIASSPAPTLSDEHAFGVEKPAAAPKSLFFNEEEMSVIKQALDNYELKMRATRIDDDYLTRLSGAPDRAKPKPAEPAPQESRIYVYPQFYLKSIMYQSPDSWTVWINDSKITADMWMNKSDLRVIDINNDRVILEWMPPSIDRVMQFWDSLGDPAVQVNVERGVITFALRQNQTFSSYRMMAMEGKIQPVQSDSNDVGALLSLQHKKDEMLKGGGAAAQPRPVPASANPALMRPNPTNMLQRPGMPPNNANRAMPPGANRPGNPAMMNPNQGRNPTIMRGPQNPPAQQGNQRRAPQAPQYKAPTLPKSSSGNL